MHAPSPRGLGKRVALALVALLLAGACHAGSSDTPALPTPSTEAAGPSRAPGGPAVAFSGAAPSVAGHGAATAGLTRVASTLPPGCQGRLERSDSRLVSVAWRCGTHVTAATVTLGGRRLALSDLLRGDYAGYLSGVAAEQFKVEGVTSAATTDLDTWYLTPAALAVAFPAGVVSYPLASLTPYLIDPASL